MNGNTVKVIDKYHSERRGVRGTTAVTDAQLLDTYRTIATLSAKLFKYTERSAAVADPAALQMLADNLRDVGVLKDAEQGSGSAILNLQRMIERT